MLDKKYVPHDLPIYPLHYHSKSTDNSDKDFILKRMRAIPEEKQKEVSDEYERLYLSKKYGDRKSANTYLHELAVKYRDRKNDI